MRVVFDCAARLQSHSLNDYLPKGLNTTKNLVRVLLRFQKDLFALAADIREMFMQVQMLLVQRGDLRCPWWKGDLLDRNQVEHQMTSHPFDATSSIFCVKFALGQTTIDWGYQQKAHVTKAVQDNSYLDGFLPLCKIFLTPRRLPFESAPC